METILRGNPVTVLNWFYTVDPLTGVETAADPTVVVFTVVAADGTSTAYVSGVDSEVTNPDVGLWMLTLDPQTPPGIFTWRAVGSGAVVAANEGSFAVLESAVLSPDQGGSPIFGPCSSWIDGEDVNGCGPDLGVGSELWRLNDAAADASAILFEVSGRQYPGICTRTVRPCRSECGCGWGFSLGAGPWFWGSWYGPLGGNYWYDEDGGRCGCQALSQVKLGGYPVRRILQVKVGGVVMPEFDTDSGARNWRLDDWRWLTRMDDPENPAVPRRWPGCQNLALDATQPGTFEVTYQWGMEAPTIAKAAAAQLARELWNACVGGATCNLPSKATRVVRQGITVDRVTTLASMFKSGATGLPLVDAFIAAANPTKMSRRPAVFSPDVQQFARKVG